MSAVGVNYMSAFDMS